MREFRKFLDENLKTPLMEPKSGAAQEAKKLGLHYVGFGRYEDPKSGQVTHIVQDGRLVPYERATQTNSYKQDSDQDLANYTDAMGEEEGQIHNELLQAMPAEGFDEAEVEAIQMYTGEEKNSEIQERLWSLPAGAKPMPLNSSDEIAHYIKNLDRAINRSKAPTDFTTYSAVSAEMLEQFQEGTQFINKGYRSTTLSLNEVLNLGGATPPGGKSAAPGAGIGDTSPRAMLKDTVVLQINVKQGQKGVYVEDLTQYQGEMEYILPRGTKFQITSGPHKLVGNSKGTRNHVIFYECEIT